MLLTATALAAALLIAFGLYSYISGTRLQRENESKKALCTPADYAAAVADADGFKDTYVYFTGTVMGVQTEKSTYNVRVSPDGEDAHYYYVAYTSNQIPTEVEIGDKVTYWAKSGGHYTYETLTGDTVTAPLAYAFAVEILEEAPESENNTQ
ncbi:hypothetical protein [Feifania hominis]|nr:hypothetical protein [Feifania hominis]